VSQSASADRWSDIRERRLSDPIAREQYERTFASVSVVRQLLQALDAEREHAGVSKSELARRVGASPAAIRRLFTSNTANPTIRTIVELFWALDIELIPQRRSERQDVQDGRRVKVVEASAGTR
jgi:ribosome-binding protein aMBF1 (putative translation factor)